MKKCIYWTFWAWNEDFGYGFSFWVTTRDIFGFFWESISATVEVGMLVINLLTRFFSSFFQHIPYLRHSESIQLYFQTWTHAVILSVFFEKWICYLLGTSTFEPQKYYNTHGHRHTKHQNSEPNKIFHQSKNTFRFPTTKSMNLDCKVIQVQIFSSQTS